MIIALPHIIRVACTQRLLICSTGRLLMKRLFTLLFVFLTAISCKSQNKSEVKSVDFSSDRVKKIQATYGVKPYRGGPFYERDWDDYAACLPKSIKQHLKDLENRLGVNRYELFTVAVGEGLGFLFDDYGMKEKNLDKIISGFVYLGTDVFGTELPTLRSRGLLPNDFLEGFEEKDLKRGEADFMLVDHERSEAADNGQTVIVKSVDFSNLKTGLTGFAALYANRRLAFEATTGRKNHSLDEYAYWTYYFYQNPGLAKKAIRSRGYTVRNTGNEADTDRPKSIPMKSLKRVATMRHVMSRNALDLSVECKSFD